ncbi:MAG TPA: bifunctional riboflavin kinase/FAD synthetase [Clostridia bacterium]|nr:bifunctional riboflavin kinase/FAD synthetase [Clostridia bacterium]HRX43332.1 bifunctional riboflavin kinase/FAD synthetase [Clostridia bacterium]
MITLTGNQGIEDLKASGIGLGNFDGVHIAHEKLISELVRECKKRGIPSIVYTFRDHPDNILQKRNIKLISPLEKRMEKFEELGVDYLVLEDFTDEFASMEATDFIEDILVRKYRISLVVTGFNYHFGKMGRGDIQLLEDLGKKNGFDIVTIAPVKAGDKVVSSTAIREYIEKGDMEEVRVMMGRYYSIKGKVEYGNRIGTLIGFPTANIIPIRDFVLPDKGVYFTKTIVDGRSYNSITNIGVRPTVSSNAEKIIETHIFNFTGWLYGKEIEVLFITKHRDEIKHNDINELKNKIETDIAEAVLFFGNHPYL